MLPASLPIRSPPLRLCGGGRADRHCYHVSRASMSPSIPLIPPAAAGGAGFKHQKYVRNPTKYWDDFYKCHRDKFFKDRHYLVKDWGHYFMTDENSEQPSVDRKVVLEVGCGAGNTLFPVLKAFPDVFAYACDFSPRAVDLVKAHETFKSDQLIAFVCDLTKDSLLETIRPASVDVVTMIFMLSAVTPEKMPSVLQNIRTALKPNGHLLFRDYAMGDYAQLELAKKDRMIDHNFYVRGDGTCAFYFSEDSLSTLFRSNGFNILDVDVYCKQIANNSKKVVMDRRWIRATLTNPG